MGFLVNGASGFTNAIALSGTTVTSTGASFNVQGANADIDIADSTVVQNNGVFLATQGAATTQFNASHATLSGAITTANDSVANVALSNGTLWTVTGNSNATSLANEASTIRFAAPSGDAAQLSSYKTITVGRYASSGGTLEINTYLGTDGSPSDRLIINGGAASGTTFLVVHNTTGPGASTQGNGIEVEESINGGTTDAHSFQLAGEARAGAFDYDLFRGGTSAGTANDWFLRSDFTVAPPPTGGGGEGGGGTTGGGGGGGGSVGGGNGGGGGGGTTGGGGGGTTGGGGGTTGGGGGTTGGGGGTTGGGGGTGPAVVPPIVSPDINVDPPTEPLAPGTYPIIGPELATYGVVQPVARQMGTTMLGTLHERIGDTLIDEPDAGSGSGWGRSAWGRFFGQQIDNRYRSFADPSASGRLLGLQAGLDLWHGSLVPGQHDTAGVYFAYANSNVDVDGLVTDLDALSYLNQHTGKVDLDAYAGGLYWTHYGQQGWYLDAVLQGTYYSGDATTANARLPVNGGGFASSLEAGYPFPIGNRFVLEPQMQVIWQYVSFSDENDGLGPVALGSSSGTTGRIGVRGRWTLDGKNGQIWQPYGRVNLWHDWGGESSTAFGADPVPLLSQATRLEFAAGVTTRIDQRFSAYLQAGYQFAVGGTEGGRRQSVQGDIGLRYRW
ncbi:autotransporter outer membrane beta-barrel domain-containing protein [Paraburkholderia acidisoli]|uniref:Autotransporter outer membrane beta-barrel domain-containing protein n=1 Tax=Paraburkholderia acidisoli TaxID=2571748 RepID=A0A7Z2GSM4_9BURK|nr:autotransporter outer membrane beta-barrel domain-containing protein [Paraburkholderia acidisoli]